MPIEEASIPSFCGGWTLTRWWCCNRNESDGWKMKFLSALFYLWKLLSYKGDIAGKLYWQEKWSHRQLNIGCLFCTQNTCNTISQIYLGSSGSITKGHRPLMIYHRLLCLPPCWPCPGTIVVEQQQLITKRRLRAWKKRGEKQLGTLPKSSSVTLFQ